jgi:hypothetical protein
MQGTDPIAFRKADRDNASMAAHKLQAFNSNAMTWKESIIAALGKAIFVKPFVEDPETGMTVRMAKYPPGS